jgi:PAS domain S-box-containing protein
MEEVLRESERQLRQQKRLVDLSRVPVFMWEIGGVIFEWNRGCEELYGYTREEAVGKRKEALLKTEVPGSSFEDVTVKLREEGVWTGELLHRAKDGRVLTVAALIQVEAVGGRQLALQSMRTSPIGNCRGAPAYRMSQKNDLAGHLACQRCARKIVGASRAARDITERKRIEAHFNERR